MPPSLSFNSLVSIAEATAGGMRLVRSRHHRDDRRRPATTLVQHQITLVARRSSLRPLWIRAGSLPAPAAAPDRTLRRDSHVHRQPAPPPAVSALLATPPPTLP